MRNTVWGTCTVCDRKIGACSTRARLPGGELVHWSCAARVRAARRRELVLAATGALVCVAVLVASMLKLALG